MGKRKANLYLNPRGRRIPFLRRAALGFVALLLAASVHAAKFTASLDRESIVLGETVTLKLEFEGANPGGMPQLPAIPGLRVNGGLSSGSSSTIGPEGQTSVTWFSVPLAATQPGEFTIPAFQLELAGQKLSSTPLKLKVLREDPISPPAELQMKPAFLWVTLPKDECYVGETMIAELRLYIRPGVRNIDGFAPPLPQGDGITSGKNWTSGGQMQRQVGERKFSVLSMFCAITAVKTGPIKISPFNTSVVLNPPPNDPFGFFQRPRDTEQVPLTTGEKEFRALRLPAENVPPGFNGAVGNYTMNVMASPTNVATGDPVTVRVQISGRGALESLALPPQDWKNFKDYPPTANVETSDVLGIQGTKSFEQIVSPESAELKEIPPFTFSYFDPEAKQYRTLTHPPTPLIVRPGGNTTIPAIAVKGAATEPTAATQDIVHIKPRLGSLKRVGPPLIRQPWFIGVNCVPVLAWLVAIGYRKRADSFANNPRLRRQRQVAQIVREGLTELRQHAAANESDKFFATLFRLMQEQLGERLNCPASAITEAVVDEKLRPRAVPDEMLSELHELFQMHNLARYAPVQSSRELAAMIPRVENALARLQEVKL